MMFNKNDAAIIMSPFEKAQSYLYQKRLQQAQLEGEHANKLDELRMQKDLAMQQWQQEQQYANRPQYFKDEQGNLQPITPQSIAQRNQIYEQAQAAATPEEKARLMGDVRNLEQTSGIAGGLSAEQVKGMGQYDLYTGRSQYYRAGGSRSGRDGWMKMDTVSMPDPNNREAFITRQRWGRYDPMTQQWEYSLNPPGDITDYANPDEIPTSAPTDAPQVNAGAGGLARPMTGAMANAKSALATKYQKPQE